MNKLMYSKTHEWVFFKDNENARIGISDFAQKSLGDIVFVNLPQINDTVQAGEAFGDVESVKAVSDINSPITGIITAVNDEVIDNPAIINEAPYDSWLIEVNNITEKVDLMDKNEYEQYCEKEAH